MTRPIRPLAIACSLLLAATASAQTAARSSTPAPPPSNFEDFLKEAKNPTDWLSWGADLRVRNEYSHEIVSLSETDDNHEQDVVRFRARLWTTVTPVTNLTFNGRLSAEPRLWMNEAFVTPYRGSSGMEWRYGIADLLNVKWDKILDQPLTITAGRQDILIGDFYDWWLVADGTPGDGSWTFFLDSIRVAWEPAPLKTRFDVIYIHQNAKPDEWIPVIGEATSPNDTDYYLTEQQERGLILYASNKSISKTQLDVYFMYKHDDREEFTFLGAERTPGDNADIYTAGGKVTGNPFEHWKYSVEGAYQFGQKEDVILGVDDTRDLDAYGAKAKLTFMLKDKLNNQFSLAGEFLSGDDPDTDSDEMFDLLWGRWPRWSELYIYSYVVETGGRIAQINNLARFGPEWSITPCKGLNFTAAYNLLYAPQEVPTRALNPTVFSQDGNLRGQYAQAVLKYQFNKHFSAHLWGEGVWQDDYYANRDFMSFFRAEVLFTF